MKKGIEFYQRLPIQLKYSINATLVVLIFLIGYDFCAYRQGFINDVFQNVMYEVHGLFFDLLILTSIFLVLQASHDENEKAKDAKSLIRELNYSDVAKDIEKKCKAIRLLNSIDITDIMLYQTILTGGNLQGIKLLTTEIYGCRFDNAFLFDSKLYGTTFKECYFNNTRFDGAKLNKATFSGCEFGNTRFILAELSGTNFSNEILSKVYFQRANLIGADFSGADLSDTDFRACDLTDANFEGATVSFKWVHQLENWEVISREQIIQDYNIEEITPEKYQLKKKN